MKIALFTQKINRLVALAGVLSAGALMGAPAIAQTTSPQAPAPVYPTETSPDAAPGTAPGVTPGAGSPTAPQNPAADPGTTPAPGASETTAPTTGTTATTDQTIVELADTNDSFNTLTQAIQYAGLTDTLSGDGPYTVFAPTDAAFAELPEGAIEFLFQPENRNLLRQVLTYHVASGEITSSDITTGLVRTLGGGLAVRVAPDRVIVNNASVVQPDVQASNGVIHAVNRVLLPPNLQQALANELGVDSIY
ncbi:MAG TPA: fasciclin domain-containing protein [Trichocoleus sp.]